MKLVFTKMNGAGNDFVMVDDRKNRFFPPWEVISKICDRRKGVGADGMIIVRSDPSADFHMDFYNSDGGPAEMCGNGARCAARFAAALGLGRPGEAGSKLHFSTDSGPIDATVDGDVVSLAMMDAREMRRDIHVDVAEGTENVHFIIVGTRHAVVFVDDARKMSGADVVRLGRAIRHHEAFGPVGANVDFASLDGDTVHLRTYEKGVEAETHACGTGSIAAAVLFAHRGHVASPVTIKQRSGDVLVVTFEPTEDGAGNVTLTGPVEVNFNGTIEVDFAK